MTKIVTSFIFLFSLFSHLLIEAQTPALDSLDHLIKTSKTDSLQLKYRISFAVRYAKIDFEKGLSLIGAIKKEALDKNFPALYADAVLNEGIVYYDKGDYIKGIVLDEEAERLYNKLPEGPIKDWGLGASYNNIGASYSLLNDLDNAQIYYLKGIDIFEKIKDSNSLLVAYFNMSFIYIDIQEWNKAYEYLIKSISYGPGTRSKDQLLQSCSRAAAICFKIGKASEGKNLLKRIDTLFKNNPTLLSEIYYYNAYGEYFLYSKLPQKALEMQLLSFSKSKEFKDPYYIVDEAWEIGRIYLQLKNSEEGKKFLQLSIDTGKAYNYLPKIRFILNEWCRYYDNIGDYKKASSLKSDLLNFTDSLITLQNHNRILLYDARYQSEKKETVIKQLESEKKIQQLDIQQQQTFNYILAGGAVTLLIISLLTYRNYKQKQRLQEQRIAELEIEKQLTVTEAVLKGEAQERTRLAKDLHDGLGGLLSGIKYSLNTMKGNLILTKDNSQAFERSLDMLDSSIKEMRRVAHNMMPEALVKFGLDTALKDFCFDINLSGALQVTYQSFGLVNATIESSTSITIYRIVQELINNTLKHASASTAIVQVTKSDSHLSVTVEDNGKGFDTSLLTQSKGIGWSNIQNRVEFLKGKLDVQSHPGKGTSVMMDFNNI